MALEFVNVAKEIGISVNLEVRTWDTILDDIHKEAVLFGFGSEIHQNYTTYTTVL